MNLFKEAQLKPPDTRNDQVEIYGAIGALKYPNNSAAKVGDRLSQGTFGGL